MKDWVLAEITAKGCYHWSKLTDCKVFIQLWTCDDVKRWGFFVVFCLIGVDWCIMEYSCVCIFSLAVLELT